MTEWIAALLGWDIGLTLAVVILALAVGAGASWERNHELVHDAHIEKHRRDQDHGRPPAPSSPLDRRMPGWRAPGRTDQ